MFLKRLPNFTVKSALNGIVVSLRALGSNEKVSSIGKGGVNKVDYYHPLCLLDIVNRERQQTPKTLEKESGSFSSPISVYKSLPPPC